MHDCIAHPPEAPHRSVANMCDHGAQRSCRFPDRGCPPATQRVVSNLSQRAGRAPGGRSTRATPHRRCHDTVAALGVVTVAGVPPHRSISSPRAPMRSSKSPTVPTRRSGVAGDRRRFGRRPGCRSGSRRAPQGQSKRALDRRALDHDHRGLSGSARPSTGPSAAASAQTSTTSMPAVTPTTPGSRALDRHDATRPGPVPA